MNQSIRLIFLVMFSVSVAGICGCRFIPFWPEPEQEEVGFGIQAEFFKEKNGEPLIRSGLMLKVGVTASGSAAVQDVMKEVDLNCQILMPLIGAVDCSGLTVIELQAKITTLYKEYFIDPQVSVNFVYQPGMKSPWGTVLMTGQVQRFGPVDMPSTRDLTVTRALMLAGGATPLADKRKLLVWRREEGGELKKFKVNIEEIGRKGRPELDIGLKPGDVVWVPESWY